jgi:Cys-tRNA(Pro)/Cys-tRNA(Cys) deacylase
MMDEIETPAIAYLRQHGIPHSLFRHAGPINSLEQAAMERNQRPEQVVRSIVFRLSGDQFIMVLMAGPGQVPWKALRKHFNKSRLTMATEDEVLQVTGCLPGTVNPFALPQPMPVLVDRAILDLPEVSFGSCQRGVAILLKPDDLIDALEDYQVVDFMQG